MTSYGTPAAYAPNYTQHRGAMQPAVGHARAMVGADPAPAPPAAPGFMDKAKAWGKKDSLGLGLPNYATAGAVVGAAGLAYLWYETSLFGSKRRSKAR